MRTIGKILALTIGMSGLAVPAVQAQKTVVWQIGQFDQASREFGSHFNLDDPDFAPVFTVGQSKVTDWPASQRSFVNGPAGKHPVPYTILFDLPAPPRGTYRLTISVILERPRVPNVLIEINGKKGLFYLNRKLSYYPGGGSVDSPIYGADQLEIGLPTNALRTGQNKLILTVVDDSEDGERFSSLTYDALSLTEETNARPESSVSVEPTVFFEQKEDRVCELTDVTVTLSEKPTVGEVVLSVGKQDFRGKLENANDFGQQRFEFQVPEFSGLTKATVSLKMNGKNHRSDVMLQPQRKWTIYFVPHAHLDIGYTDYQAKVGEVQSRNIDKLLEFVPKNPEMRFSLDGSWVVQNYLATRNDSAKNEFFQLVRDGKITVPAQYANLLTGYASLEELIRSTDYSYALHRRENIPFNYANITDVPSQTWSYTSVLNASGLKYFASAANSDRGPILLYGRWNEKSPFWREGPDGSKVLMAYTRQYSQLWFVCDQPPEMASCRQGLPTFLQTFQSFDYKPDAVLMYGSQFENTDLRLNETEFVPQWNSHYAYPKFVISTFPDYFRYVEKNYGSQLQTVTGDGGPYWEDGIGSDANNTALDRSDQERALSAEKLSTISTFLTPTLAAPRELIDRIWKNLILYAEHTWDSGDSIDSPDSQQAVRQLATKDHFAKDGQQAVNALVEQSLSQIANQIHMPSASLVVFNTLSWQRNGLVETDLDPDMSITDYLDKKPVPLEVLREGRSYKHVRFLAKEVPSMGFKCYALQQEKEKNIAPVDVWRSPQTSNTVENSFYRVQVDPATGAVKSIFDKQLSKELVDSSSPYKLNQYLYVAGGDVATQIVHMQKSLPLAKLTVSPSTDGQIVGLRKTPYGQILTVESKDVHTSSIQTDIILFDDEKKIEFVDHFTKEPVREKEAVYFAFPFAASKHAFLYEIQNGWVDPSRDMMKGAGVEWFSAQHWVRASNGDWDVAVVPVDAPLITLGDINRGVWPEKFDPKSSTVFSYVLNNYWHTNYRAEQGGDFTFRYILTSSSSLSPEYLARFGRAEMTPLETGELIENDKDGNPPRPLEPVPASFLQVDALKVVVENWKAANDGQGTIVRLLEVGGQTGYATLTFPLFSLEHVWMANAVEENQEEIPISGPSVIVPVQSHQIVTLRIAAAMKQHE